MATIKTRQRKDGSLAYLSEVRVKRDGETVHRESRTFDRRAQARAWAENREKRFAKEIPVTRRPQREKQATLRDVLRRYREEISEVRPMGRSKTSHIRFLEKCKIARMTACENKSSGIIAHVRLRRQLVLKIGIVRQLRQCLQARLDCEEKRDPRQDATNTMPYLLVA